MSYNQEMLESRQLLDYLKLGKSATIECAVGLADNQHNSFGSDLNSSQLNDKLKNEMISLIDLEIQLKNSVKASLKTDEQIRQMINDLENERNNSIINANVNQIFDENLAQIRDQNNTIREDDENYKQLIEILNEFTSDSLEGNQNNDSNDDELMTLETEQRIPIDPFSKKEIVNPVKNKKCHHIYDREQLKQVLESRLPNNARIRCPIVGCNNKSVTMSDVCDDRKTKAMIDNIRRQLNY